LSAISGSGKIDRDEMYSLFLKAVEKMREEIKRGKDSEK